MTLDVGDSIRSILESVTNPVGAAIFAGFFVIQGLNLVANQYFFMGPGSLALGGAIYLVTTIAAIVLTVGALRSFDTGELKQRYFTQDLVKPVLRLFGINVVTGAFAFLAAIPAFFVLGLMGLGVASTTGAVLFAAALLVAVYVFLTLSMAIPSVAIESTRLFESLDDSVQRTSGSKGQMLLVFLPLIAVYLLNGLAAALMASTGMTGAYTVIATLLGALTATLFYATLVELHQRL